MVEWSSHATDLVDEATAVGPPSGVHLARLDVGRGSWSIWHH